MANPIVQVQESMGVGGLSRVDTSLIPQTQVGTDVYQNVRLIRTSQNLISGDQGTRKIVFSPPNSGLLNLREITINADLVLDGMQGAFPFVPSDGSVWKWDGSGSDDDGGVFTNTSTKKSYVNNIQQGLSDPFFFTVLERVVVTTGGTPFIDIRDLNLINHMALKQEHQPLFMEPRMSTYQGYDADNKNRVSGSPGTGYWEYPERMTQVAGTRFYQLRSRRQPIVIRPFMFENALLNKTNGVLPLTLMPNVTIELYFAASQDVLYQALTPGYGWFLDSSSVVGRVNYTLENFRMECLLAGSNSLEKALIGQGMSMTYRDYAHFTQIMPTLQGKMQWQIPVTQRAIEEVYVIMRPNGGLNNITTSGKFSLYLAVSRQITNANILINGIRRYGEDLDSRGTYNEFVRLEPQAKMSDLFQDEWRDWNYDNQLIVLSAKMDYSKELLSGIKTASQTSPLIVELQFLNNVTPPEGNQILIDFFVKYTRWLSITREQIEVID